MANAEMLIRAWESPNTKYGFISPIYAQAREQYRRQIFKLPHEIIARKSDSELRIDLINGSSMEYLSGDNPNSIRGKTFNGVLVDEVRDQSPSLWPMILRPMLTTTRGFACFLSTPSGMDYFFDIAEKAKTDPDWELFTGPSTENPLFTASEFESAKKEMSGPEFRQEILAEFIDLHRGKAYLGFGSHNLLERSPFTTTGDPLVSPYLPIVVGLDFNVNPMHWTLGQQRNEDFYWYDEIHVSNTNTQECARELVERIGAHPPGVVLCGDASGNSRHTSASESDYVIICQALDAAKIKWQNRTPDANPSVKERVNTVNSKLKAADGSIHMWLHPTRCPMLKKDFERVSWKAGAQVILDQTTSPELTHASDSIGYPVVALSPMQISGAVGVTRVIWR